MKTPLKVYVALTAHKDATDHYLIELSAPNTEMPIASAQIAHPENGNPELTSIEEGLLRALDPGVRAQFVLLLYRFCRDEMVAANGTAIQRTIADLTKLLDAKFTNHEREAIQFILNPLTASQEVVAHSIVRID